MANTTLGVDLELARQWVRQEASALMSMAEHLGESFVQAIELIYGCEGSVVLSGIGKAGIVAQKISSTLTSTGTPSSFLHAAEAIHGDLGRLQSKDIAIVLSNSGQSSEIIRLISLLKQLGIPMIGLTSQLDSPLAQHSTVALSLGNIEEICPLGLAPSTSTTCMMALGDVLALTVMKLRDFKSEDFARYHPGGSLGRQLMTVEQATLFTPDKVLPKAPDSSTVAEALKQAEEATALRHGCILLINQQETLTGLITDGDLRRGLAQEGPEFYNKKASDIMTTNPKTVHPDTLASEAMAIFHQHRIDELPVVDKQHRPVGLIDVQDVLALKVLE